MAASVVDLPEPVGPVTSTMPRGLSARSPKIFGALSCSRLRILEGMVRNTAAAPRFWLNALTRKRASPSISNEKSTSRNSSYCLRWVSFMMSYTMACTCLWSSASMLMRRTSPCTRIIGGRPADKCRSDALFLTLNASSWVISTSPSRIVQVAPADYDDDWKQPPNGAGPHRRGLCRGATPRDRCHAARRVQDLRSRCGARGPWRGPARLRRELHPGSGRQDGAAGRPAAGVALHRPGPEQQDASGRAALRLDAHDRPPEDRAAARRATARGSRAAERLHPGEHRWRRGEVRRRPRGRTGART